MARKINWDNQFGRRLKLRDLHVFFTVVQAGSMAKAAAQLGVSQPTVSERLQTSKIVTVCGCSIEARAVSNPPCTGRPCTDDASQRSTN